MSRFEQILTPPNDTRLAELYQELMANGFNNGSVPINWFTAQATRPDILAATWSFTASILVKGQLPATIKQMIAVTISTQNNCRYCSLLHTEILEDMGVPTEVIEACASDPAMAHIPPAHRQILKFALKAAQTPHAMTDEDFEALRENGLADDEILEVAMISALTNFLNTWSDANDIPVNTETQAR